MSKTLATLPEELKLGTFLLQCTKNEDGTTSFSISIPDENTKLRDDAILKAQEYIDFEVTTENFEDAKKAASILKGIDSTAEKDRVRAKNPFKESGEFVDELAKGFKTPVTETVKKLEKALSDFIIAERKKADDLREEQNRAEQSKRDEEAKKQREAQAEIDRLEAQRQEALNKAANLKTQAARNKASLEAIDLQNQRDEIEIKLGEAQPAPVAPVVFVRPPDTTGSAVSDKFEIDVYDVAALYAKFPQFVELTPKRADLLAYVKICNGQNIPGVTYKKVVNVSVKAAK